MKEDAPQLSERDWSSILTRQRNWLRFLDTLAAFRYGGGSHTALPPLGHANAATGSQSRTVPRGESEEL